MSCDLSRSRNGKEVSISLLFCGYACLAGSGPSEELSRSLCSPGGHAHFKGSPCFPMAEIAPPSFPRLLPMFCVGFVSGNFAFVASSFLNTVGKAL